MPDPTFDLTSNPFHQLGVTARDGLERIGEAAEEAEASGRLSSQVARDAQRQLATSRPRLAAELRWLPGVHPDAASHLVKALSKRSPAKVREILPQLPGLARANVAAHLCSCGSDVDVPLGDLIGAQALIAADEIVQRVNNERDAAGLPRVTRDLVAGGLSDVIELHARAAVQGLLQGSGGAETLVSALQDSDDDRGRIRALLERIVDRFDSAVAPRLSATEDQIEAAAQAIRKQPDDVAAVDRLKAGIMLWSQLTMPRRSISSRLGIDDKRASEFLKHQRGLCLPLANDHGAHACALDITRLLASLFADQKGWAARLADDMRVLEEHVAADRNRAVLDPLEHAVEAARGSIKTTIASLDSGGFGPGSTGVVGDLFRAFAAAAAASQTLGADRDVPWLMLRSLAIGINNDHHRPGAALKLVDGALRHGPNPPPEALDTLRRDRAVLAREHGLARAKLAASAGRFLEAKGIVQRLLEDERDPDRRKQLEEILRSIAAQEARRRNSWIGWAVAAGIAFVIYLGSQSGQPPSGPGYTSTPWPNLSSFSKQLCASCVCISDARCWRRGDAADSDRPAPKSRSDPLVSIPG